MAVHCVEHGYRERAAIRISGEGAIRIRADGFICVIEIAFFAIALKRLRSPLQKLHCLNRVVLYLTSHISPRNPVH
jgi:RecB family endonuclease NucS